MDIDFTILLFDKQYHRYFILVKGNSMILAKKVDHSTKTSMFLSLQTILSPSTIFLIFCASYLILYDKHSNGIFIFKAKLIFFENDSIFENVKYIFLT